MRGTGSPACAQLRGRFDFCYPRPYLRIMCGQFEALLQIKRLMDEMRLEGGIDQPSYDVVKPTLGAPILISHPDHGGLEMTNMRFGLVPHWYRQSVKDFKATTFNARVEEVSEKPTFKGAYKYRRGIVPAEAFYEWSGPKNDRRKWRITRGDNHPLGFAAIWDEALCTEGELFSFALLTRAAGPDMSAIHTREPIALAPDQWEDWIRLRPVDTSTPAPLRLTPDDGGSALLF